MTPSTCSGKKSGVQQEGEHEVARVVISAGRNYFSRPGGRNWQKLAETGLNRQKLAEIKNLNLMD